MAVSVNVFKGGFSFLFFWGGGGWEARMGQGPGVKDGDLAPVPVDSDIPVLSNAPWLPEWVLMLLGLVKIALCYYIFCEG